VKREPHLTFPAVAISRLLYEFAESLDAQYQSDLVQTMCVLLDSRSREVVKSLLGFIKVALGMWNTKMALFPPFPLPLPLPFLTIPSWLSSSSLGTHEFSPRGNH
jgi:hypothetical protein